LVKNKLELKKINIIRQMEDDCVINGFDLNYPVVTESISVVDKAVKYLSRK